MVLSFGCEFVRGYIRNSQDSEADRRRALAAVELEMMGIEGPDVPRRSNNPTSASSPSTSSSSSSPSSPSSSSETGVVSVVEAAVVRAQDELLLYTCFTSM